MQHVMRRAGLPPVQISFSSANVARCARYSTNPKADLDITKSAPHLYTNDNGLTRTYRIRQHGNRSLPIPDILDPLYLSARHDFLAKKPKQENSFADPTKLTPFQRELSMNVHARALAKPVRMCALTRARLPTHFLIRFCLIHPKAEDTKPMLTPAILFRPIGVSSYVSATKDAVQQLGNKGKWVALASPDLKAAYARAAGKNENSVNPAKDWSWHREMAEVVEEQLKRAVINNLEYCHRHDPKLLRSEDETNGVEKDQIACVVRLRGREKDVGQAFSDAEGDSLQGCSTYDLTRLFSPGDFEKLCAPTDNATEDNAKRPWAKGDRVVVMKDLQSVTALLSLDRLQNYLYGTSEYGTEE